MTAWLIILSVALALWCLGRLTQRQTAYIDETHMAGEQIKTGAVTLVLGAVLHACTS